VLQLLDEALDAHAEIVLPAGFLTVPDLRLPKGKVSEPVSVTVATCQQKPSSRRPPPSVAEMLDRVRRWRRANDPDYDEDN